MSSNIINFEFDEALDELVQELLSSSESDGESRRHGGSTADRRRNIDRERQSGYNRLYRDYLCPTPVYDERCFRRRFRVSKRTFHLLCTELRAKYHYFGTKKDCTGQLSFKTEQKVASALRLLGYGSAYDSVDEYIRMSESTAADCLKRFCRCVVEIWAPKFLRCPSKAELETLLRETRTLGFPGMIGSIDCSKWLWKNCPVAWRGQFQGKERKPGVTLEVVADHHLYIWHAFFGAPGSANDLNVLETSPLLNKIANGSFPPRITYSINGKERDVPYFLCDGIYPKYPIFVHTVQEPTTRKEKNLAACQEGRRKDVERAFGVLQGRWHILQRASRFWHVETMKCVMYCCIILHNMMIQEGLNEEEQTWATEVCPNLRQGDVVHMGQPVWGNGISMNAEPGSIAALCKEQEFLKNEVMHSGLQQDIMEHLWSVHGSH